MTPLESRLTAALAADVVRFDSPDAERQTLLLDSERFEPDLVPLRLDGRSPRHGRTTAGVAAAALLCLAIVATVVRRDDDSRGSDTGSVPSSTSSAVVHPGIEQPLVETAAGPVQDAYKPGSVHAFSVEGHPDLLLWTTLSINPATGAPEEFQCVSEVGSSGCGPTSIPAQFGQTSSIDNGFATDDLFTWINLPADVDTVEYDDGFVQLWQRPVAGLAIFRVDPNHPHPSIKAVDATGAVLPYSFWGNNPAQNSVAPPLQAHTNSPATEPTARAVQSTSSSIDSGTWGELETLTKSSLQDCLAAKGAKTPPGVTTGIDAVAVWNSCVAEVTSIVTARQADLDKGK